ncbi:MAG: flagellar basal body-associated FliL family protein [Deltaproteobacteria bacterium]|nr:flagellar basal body-associated FliL family protein [Deltaproteobacteria bacterium]
MVKKVKLDILDIDLDDEQEASSVENIPLEKNDSDQQGDNQTEAGAFLPKIGGAWVQKPFWGIVIGAVSLVLLAGTGLSVWLLCQDDTPVAIQQTKQGVTRPSTVKKGNIALFEGFVIDLKDEKSNTRIVLCDVGIELKGVRDTCAIENRGDARKVIYIFLQNRKLNEILGTAERNRLKEDLKKEMNRFFGEELVNSIYFARIEAI